MTKMNDARRVLGGKVSNFKGKMPGVAEEALTTINRITRLLAWPGNLQF
jgi:hypothetical protein